MTHALLLYSGYIDNIGLLNGKMGCSIFFFQLARRTGNTVYENYAGSLVDQVTDGIHSGMSTGFCSGLSGVAWGVQYLFTNGFAEADEENILQELDIQIYQTDRKQPQLEKDYTDFDGHLLYYLVRYNGDIWNEEVFGLLWSDLKQQLTQPVREAALEIDYILSQLYFVHEIRKRQFCPSDIGEVIAAIPAYISFYLKAWNPVEYVYLDHLLTALGLPDLEFSGKDFCESSPGQQVEWQSQLAVYKLVFPEVKVETEISDSPIVWLESSSFWNKLTGKEKVVRYGFVKYAWHWLSHSEINLPELTKRGNTIYIFNHKSRAAEYGIGTYIQELTGYLQNTSLSFILIHFYSEKQEFTIEKKNGIQHWYFPALATFDPDTKWDYYLQSMICLLRLHIHSEERPVFHLNYMQDYQLVCRLKENFTCKILLVVHYMNWAFGVDSSKMKEIIKKQEHQLINPTEKNALKLFNEEKRILDYVDHVVGLADYAFDLLHDDYKIPAPKITIINNGLADLVHNSSLSKEQLRKKYFINGSEKIILFAGRLDAIKGVTCLIKAFREILKKEPNVRLWIVGNGDYNALLGEIKDAWNQICFTGQVSREQLFELYQLADIGVAPSLFEPFGYVPVEMMMSGLPVVATSTSGPNEIVEDGVTGFKIPIQIHGDKREVDVSALSERLLYLLEHPEECQKMGSNGRKRYLEKYTDKTMGSKMLTVYDNMMQY